MNSKLQNVLLEYGAEGYGTYWYCLELISSNVEPENLTFELEHDARIIARNLGLGVQRVEEMMKYMIEQELFEASEGMITCMKLAKRADDYTTKIVKTKVTQVADNNNEKLSPTKSDKDPLDKNRIDKNRIEKNTKRILAREALDYLNHVSGKRFRPTDTNIKNILSRLDDYEIGHVRFVIENKTREWKGGDMEKYLRPETLFNKTKFEGYVNEPLFDPASSRSRDGSASGSTRSKSLLDDLTDREWAN